jgi:thiamine-phosphate pyrophosphorylase
MLLYYITDRHQFRGGDAEQRQTLLAKIAEAASCGVDYIQLREKDLSARELLKLAEQALRAIGQSASSHRRTQLLVNSRIDVALASGASGVHLRADDISAADARAMVMGTVAKSSPSEFLVATSCHTAEDVNAAASEGADFAVFAPVFEKAGTAGVGLDALRSACRGTERANTPEPSAAVKIPVLALGGITIQNARRCVDAGAAGIAGIRLFQENDVAELIGKLRASGAGS